MVTTPAPTPGNGDEKKIINPESMILPDPQIIAFLAETTWVGQDEILKNFEPSIYLPDLGIVHECITEAFGIEYTVPETILQHVSHLIEGEGNSAKNSIKLYFSDKDAFRDKIGYDKWDKRELVEIGDNLAKKFEKFFELLIAKIAPRKKGE